MRADRSVLVGCDLVQSEPARHPGKLLLQHFPCVRGSVILEGHLTDDEPRGLTVTLEIDACDEPVAEEEGQNIVEATAFSAP